MPAPKTLDRSQLKIIASLGGHATRLEARRIAQAIHIHKPRVLILEDAAAEPATRLSKIQRLNDDIRRAREGGLSRRRFMATYVEAHSTKEFEPFRRAQFEAILDARNLVAWVIEEHGPEFQQALRDQARLGGELIIAYYNAILDGRTDEAARKNLEFEVEAERLIGRKEAIRAGIERLPIELPEVFPRTGGAEELVLLASYGAAHYQAFRELGNAGWSVAVEIDAAASEAFVFRCIRSIIEEGLEMVPGNRARLLYMTLYGDMEQRQVPLAGGAAEQAFQNLGGEEGFLTTLDRIAQQSAGDGGLFISSLFAAFAAAHRS